MSKGLVFGAAAAALVMLAGCAYDYGYGYPYGYGVAAGYGAAPIYYDNFYGPYWDGYWGPEGAFWYSTGPGRPFIRDAGGHFRNFGGRGFHAVGGGRFRRG